ncbi:MAG: hypothetical protein LBU82_05190 [Treponema sp.]|nr:hypothetical protein [Treponema sp.]
MLNKPKEKRLKNIDETLNKFPYVDGGLFEERLEIAAFNSAMRKTLLKCCTLDWSQIKPEIFGAMFQSVKDKESRRELGEHYTSEANILKVIRPLFLDALWEEFEKIRKLSYAYRQQRFLEFHTKLRGLKFLDPACGCGNFLVVSYRELRLLEIELLTEYMQTQQVTDIELLIRVNVDQFYGIEIEEFPARIAQTALWLMDHLMNKKASERFGKYIVRIPLTASPSIVNANALTADWEKLVPKNELSYILGNPPFLGSRIMNKQQKKEVEKTFNGLKYYGELDYVCCWYGKAAEYIQGTGIECAFVSTNSICQGFQVPILWPELINKHGIKINFAHQTFKWGNEARGKAAVYCVIIGFALADRNEKKIYQYAAVTGEPMETPVKQINSYLVEGADIFIMSRASPICGVPEMNFGNMPADGGELLFSKEEKEKFLIEEPEAGKYIKRFISAYEFLNNKERYCLWLADVEPGGLKKLKLAYERVKKVKEIREKSARPFLANVPHLFAQITQPAGKDYILIPRVSSETRKYIPIGFFKSNTIASDTCMIIPDGALYHFGILTSGMHMAWVRYVCGRLKSDYRYSKDIVYNNFPWPDPSEKQRAEIEKAAQEVLDARSLFPNDSLADLYDPVAMPPALSKAHQKLDKAVEAAYGRSAGGASFDDDRQRVAYLFELYQKLSGDLFTKTKKKGKRKKE